MKKILLLITAFTLIGFTSCSQQQELEEKETFGTNDSNLKTSSVEKVKTEITITLNIDYDIKTGYIVKAYEEVFDPKKIGKEEQESIDEVESDSDGKVKFEFEYIPTTNKTFYFEVFKEINGKETLTSKERTKVEVKDEDEPDQEYKVEITLIH